MKTALRLCFGLLLSVSTIGCHTCGHNSCQPACDSGCGHRSCLHKVVNKFRGCKCGCQSGCGCDVEQACDCGHHHVRHKSRVKYDMPIDATMHGYDKSVVYTGDDWQGIPQPMISGGCSGCAGGSPMMSMPTAGCAGCAGSGISPAPGGGGCASCGGSGIAPPSTNGTCASCGGNHPTPAVTPSTPSGGGCASCGTPTNADSFYNPLGPNHLTPAPVPPVEGTPGPNESLPGEKAATSGDSIQKIHWVPRQL